MTVDSYLHVEIRMWLYNHSCVYSRIIVWYRVNKTERFLQRRAWSDPLFIAAWKSRTAPQPLLISSLCVCVCMCVGLGFNGVRELKTENENAKCCLGFFAFPFFCLCECLIICYCLRCKSIYLAYADIRHHSVSLVKFFIYLWGCVCSFYIIL